ncbi:site-specific integrase [Olivibacter sp. LS-1]|uniref:site-specific integrase n=1 Tax=Olivibacter sp. LS-1 TaxID=2592345 RepID=UPI0011EB6633|nr:site-specific integrase [Olivibacter sp. LS-1]QEL01540.1 site-specific integrase [Olivibacter sp. LS-1]
MATVSAVILNHHQKQDGTWNVKVRVSHNSKSAYIDTTHFVSTSHLTAKKGKDKTTIYKLKQAWLDKYMADTLTRYRDKITELGERLYYMDCHAIKEYLTAKEGVIDLFEFADEFFERETKKGRITSVITMRSSILSLRDYWGERPLPTDMFTSKLLQNFEMHLRSNRTVERTKRNGGKYTREVAGLSHNTIVNRMSNLRTVFNAAKSFYNDEDSGIIRIKNNPFSKYKMNEIKATRKRNLDPEQLKAIRDIEVYDIRTVIARDLFMLSFYMCGMNAKDMYEYLKGPISSDRLEYNRSKTKGKRKDDAFISIFIPQQARKIIDKYSGLIQERYANNLILNRTIGYGMRKIGEILKIERMTFYHARHTFASWARNHCGYSVSDVAEALNHTDLQHRITKDYIDYDWSLIDRIQSDVIAILEKEQP